MAMWSWTCQKELCRLLSNLWPSLSSEASQSLVEVLLAGPPASMFSGFVSEDKVPQWSTHDVVDRLEALEATVRPLPPAATVYLEKVRSAWRAKNGTAPVPRQSLMDLTDLEVADVLQAGFSENERQYKEWVELVSSNWPQTIGILNELSRRGSWSAEVWTAPLSYSVALIGQGQTETNIIPLLDAVIDSPDEFARQALNQILHLLLSLPRTRNASIDERFWRLWDRAFSAARTQPASAESGSFAAVFRSTIGRLTLALFERADRLLEDEAAPRFWDRLRAATDDSSTNGATGRYIAAEHLAWLFEQDSAWTRSAVLPLFDWDHPEHARVAWQAFMSRPSLSPSLWNEVKPHFLTAFRHLSDFTDRRRRDHLYQLVGRIALSEPGWLTDSEAQRIVTTADHAERTQIAWVLWSGLDAAAGRAAQLWRERVHPWLNACWQPDAALKDDETAQMLIMAALSAKEAIPEAIDLIVLRLPALNRPTSALMTLKRSGAPARFPFAALKLLDRIVNRNQQFYKGHLAQLLQEIATAWPEAACDSRYVELSEFAARG